MAELDILPAWAIHYLNENILDHARVLNALPIEDGRNSYLLNTSRGALILSKKRFGEPHHWLLPLPGTRVDFDCDVCSERMGFINPEVPRMVHCPHCAAEYTLVEEAGELLLMPSETIVDLESEPTGSPEPDPLPPAPPEPRPEPEPEPEPEPYTEPEPGPLPPASLEAAPATAAASSAVRSGDYRDYLGDVHPVMEVEGIGPVYAANLKRIGVLTTARLCYEDAESLAERIGARQKTVESWQDMAQLMKIKGVGPQYAEVLVRSGIRMDELRRRSPTRIADEVNAYHDSLDTNVLGNRVTPKRVARWQETAKSMQRVKQPVPLE